MSEIKEEEVEAELIRMNVDPWDSYLWLAIENIHRNQKIKSLQTEIEDLKNDIIRRNSDRNELYLKEKDKVDKLRGWIKTANHSDYCQNIHKRNKSKGWVSSCTCGLEKLIK